MLFMSFLDKLPARLEKMRAALEQQDLEELRVLAHRLSGTAGSYGLKGVGARAGDIERALDGGATKAELEELLVTLEQEIESARTPRFNPD